MFAIRAVGDDRRMDNELIFLSTIPLPAPAQGTIVPEWVHLVPKGTFQSRDGRGPWVYTDAKALIEESYARRRHIHIDENHSTDTAAKIGFSAPARGFITEMEERENGIWGKVQWNESGKALLSDRAYWGISPVLSHDKKTGRVSAIARAALTNDPALRELIALNSTETMMDRSKLARMLGLSEDASETELETTLATRLGDDGEKDTALTTSLSQIGTAMGLEGEVSLSAILATAKGLKAAGDAQAEQLATLQTEVTGLKEAGKRKAAEDYVDGAIRDRRAGVKASREDYVALHMEDAARCEKIIKGLPKLDPTNATIEPPAPKEGEVALSTEQQCVADMLGLDPAAMAKTISDEETLQ
ncbi:Mu-like prophage I protein [Marinibacterium anthonyi]|nr:Mu-like prophage I protein [Marinibacterium anthonyi]